MLKGEYVKNNTRFCKPTKRLENDLLIRNIVFITSDNLKENLEALVNEEGINTLRLTDDYKLDNLDFLVNYNLSFIKSIDILSESVSDISGIYSLNNLEIINSVNQKIDYTKFTKLIEIRGELSNYSYKTLSNVRSLAGINISNKFKESDLTILKENVALKYITLRGSKITSLNGLENFKELEKLSLFHNKSLTSLEGISKEHIKLREIYIYIAPKLFYVNNYLSFLPSLEKLQLEAKRIDSFSFLNDLNNLKLLSIHNRLNDVEDGDKSPLIDALKRTNGKIW